MSPADVIIHPSASVYPGAELGPGVYVGPGCVIGPLVSIGANTRLEANIQIAGRTRIGEDCVFSPFTAIGGEPQDTSYKGEDTGVVIGDRNVFREFITVHRGTSKGGATTTIGSDNYFMAYSHIAHDCRVGQETVFTNAATLGGHVVVDDFASIGAFSGVHQFCRVGNNSMRVLTATCWRSRSGRAPFQCPSSSCWCCG